MPRTDATGDSAAVATFIAGLDQPARSQTEALREIILGADERIGEGIKWNAPSFSTTEHFATLNYRSKAGITIVLHLGAKVRTPAPKVAVDDPLGMLEWKSSDRALVTFRDLDEINDRGETLQQLVRQWIAYV
ncbi:hypothetical protein BH10ACT3_BH10ACT3_06360 [soil metagenome]